MSDMSKNEIMEELKKAVEKRLGNGFCVSLQAIKKNKGSVKDAIIINESSSPIASIIYIDDMVKEIQYGALSLVAAVNRIAESYKEGAADTSCPYKVANMMNKKDILTKVIYRLINREKNEDMLVNIPHRDFLDLAVIYTIVEGEEDGKQYSCILDYALCQKLDISQEKLEAAAAHNTKARRFHAWPMEDVLGRLIGKASDIIPPAMPYAPCGPSMWVLTNTSGNHGASVLLYQKYFDDVATKLDDDLYIMPSSIHEVISVPASDLDPIQLKGIVKDINCTEVAPEEVLSDNVYIYRKDSGMISIAS